MVYYQVHEIMLAKNDITVILIVNISFSLKPHTRYL